MEIILVAILALVLLSPLDAARWAGTTKKKRTRPTTRAHRARRRSRRTASSHPFPSLSYATPRASTATRARWWWE